MDEHISGIEQAFIGHRSHFGRWPRGTLIEQACTIRFETPRLRNDRIAVGDQSLKLAHGRGVSNE